MSFYHSDQHQADLDRRPFQRLLSSLLALLAPVASIAGSDPEYWAGTLSYRGADTPMRLELLRDAVEPQAWLDLPGLIMAREPVPISHGETELHIELPFGIGTFPLIASDGGIQSEQALGEHMVQMRLSPASPPPYRRQELGFESRGVQLAAELLIPAGPGPHPGVVLLHGSAPLGRESWSYRSWADLLARQGFATLYYDKRGVGASGGDSRADLRLLADDAVAAMRALRARPEINAQRTGFKGSSQGAWLALQAAVDLGDVGFLLLTSAPAVTPRQQELQQLEYGMRADGRPEAEIQAALSYTGLYFYVASTGTGWPLLAQAVEHARAEPWGQYVDQPQTLAQLDWWKANHALQPAGLAAALDLPVLLLYGGGDWVTPAIENAEKLRRLFAHPGKVEVHIFAGADHRLELGWGADDSGHWQWARIAPGLFDVLPTWLQRLRD